MARVLEDSMHTHGERQWVGLEEMTALSAAGDVAIPELEMVPKEEVVEEPPVAAFHPGLVGQGWSWSCTAEQMAAAASGAHGANWRSRRGEPRRGEGRRRPLYSGCERSAAASAAV